MTTYTLKLSPGIANEWMARSIGGVIPALDECAIAPGRKIMVSRATIDEIVEDCEYMLHPNGPYTFPDERRAYRSMLRQCAMALAIGPIDNAA